MAITLLPGEYVIDAALVNTSGATIDQVSRALRFTVLNTAERGVDDYPWATVNGHVRPDTDWTVYSVDEVVETT